MQRVFITGGTGFLGAHLICELLEKGYDITALKRMQSGMNELNYIAGLYFGHDYPNVIKNIKWVDGDICDYTCLDENIDKDMLVFHCAALVSFSPKDKESLFKINIEGTANIVNVCLSKGCQKLIYTSSTAAVGRAEGDSLSNENHLWDEKDQPTNYSISKYYAELEVWRGIEEGLSAVIVNPPIILGPGDYKKFSGKFFINASNNFPFFTIGSNAFVYVKDVSRLMVLFGESNLHSERYLLVSENLSYKDLMVLISETLKKKPPFISLSSKLLDLIWPILKMIGFVFRIPPVLTKESARSASNRVQYSNKKVKDALGFQFTPIKKAVIETCAYFEKK